MAKYLLGHEREMISGFGLAAGADPLIQAARAGVDPILRAQIALFDVRARAFAAASEKFLDELKAGKAHPAQPSLMKYFGTELNKARHELLMAAGGSETLEWESEATSQGRPGARVAAHQGQFDRGRDQRDPAQHHRQADSRPPLLTTVTPAKAGAPISPKVELGQIAGDGSPLSRG